MPDFSVRDHLGATPTRPVLRGPLVGRERVTAAGCVQLVREAVPLLTLTGPGGVGGGDQPQVDQLGGFLRPRQLLLLPDNCEHMLVIVPHLMANLLAACLALQVLVTSQAPLRVQ